MPVIAEDISPCVSVESVQGSDIFVRFENGQQRKVNVANGRTICEIDLVKGDHAELMTGFGNKRDMIRIRPFRKPRKFDGKITYTDNVKFALIDDKIVIYDTYAIESLKIGDGVNGLFIDGDYHHKNDYYVKRAIEIQSKVRSKFNRLSSSDFMRFKNAVPYQDVQYDIPCGLYENITSNNVPAIMEILDNYLPRQELAMANIGERFHALVNIKGLHDADPGSILLIIIFFIWISQLYLEEIELKRTFEFYKTDDCKLTKEKKKFSIFSNMIEGK